MAWTILGKVTRSSYVSARCDCGRVFEVDGRTIRSGASTRCRPCASTAAKTTHGESRSPEYRTWLEVVRRPLRPGYEGIEVTAVWTGIDGFVHFLEHIGRKPTPAHTIDRIDGKRGYVPGNVRWATMREQNQNRRDNVLLTIGAETYCVAEWARRSGTPVMTIRNRLARGLSHADAIQLKPRTKPIGSATSAPMANPTNP